MEVYNTIVLLGLFALWGFGSWFIWTRPAMEIRKSTPSKLTLNIYPFFFRIIAGSHRLLGIILLLFPVLTTPQIVTLTCNRVFPSSPLEKTELISNMVQCEIVEIAWFGNLKKIPIFQLQGARLETSSGKDNEISYQIVLLTDKSKIPFRWHGDFQRKSYEALNIRINTFVKNSIDTTLTVQQDNREINYTFFVLGGFLFLLSFLFVAIAPTINCTLEQDFNNFILKRQRFFGVMTFQYKLALNHIAKAVLEYGEGGESSNTRITFILNTGEKIPLTKVYTSDGKEEIAITIQNFLESYKFQHKPNEKSN